MENQIKCPRCNAIQVTPGSKGYSVGKGFIGGALLGPIGLVAGALGSKRTTLSCLMCGHQWDILKEIKRKEQEAALKKEVNELKKAVNKVSKDKTLPRDLCIGLVIAAAYIFKNYFM